MDKITYLAELAEGLARWVPERERQDILRYYAEYFEEAGPGREAEVVAELGDPWALSCRLAVEGGYVSQEGAERWTPPRKKRRFWPVALVVVIAISAITLAARFGGWIGRVVSGHIGGASVDVVEEAVPSEGLEGGAAYIEGDGIWVSQENGSLDAFDRVEVEVGLGNVSVQAADDYALYIEQPADLDHEVKWKVSDGKLKVEAKGSGKDLEGVDVTVYVPEGDKLEKAKLSTGTGDVRVIGLCVEKLEAASGLGDIQCLETVALEELKLDSGTGNVVLDTEELYSGAELELHSGIGQVEAYLPCMERDCSYDLSTGFGAVNVNGERRGSSAKVKSGDRPYKLEAASGTGDVSVVFTED